MDSSCLLLFVLVFFAFLIILKVKLFGYSQLNLVAIKINLIWYDREVYISFLSVDSVKVKR